ncbi:hypothetical protein ES703_117423 [subsurface metagenome]
MTEQIEHFIIEFGGKKEGMSPFLVALTREVLDHLCESYGTNNYDFNRFGRPRNLLKIIMRHTIASLLKRVGIGIVVQGRISNNFDDMVSKFGDGLSCLYNMLEDDYSRRTLVSVIAYRILGRGRIKLPVNTPEYWAMRKRAQALISGKNTIRGTFRDKSLNAFKLDDIGYSIHLYALPSTIVNQFMLHQYSYERISSPIKVEVGDFVIDGGSCWGDVTLFFAHGVGATGKVYSFEFVPENIEILAKNLHANKELALRVEVVQRALWSASGERLSYSYNGPASRVSEGKVGELDRTITTVTIDDFVADQKIPKVDFIKMDIEGAELPALKGAKKTINNYKPKLAISVYHNLKDFVNIPEYLESLETRYKFYLDHYTIHAEETVLFAVPEER